MKRVVLDASVLAAIAFAEPEAAVIAEDIDGSEVHAPTLLRYEMANIALKKIRQRPDRAGDIVRAVSDATGPRWAISWHDVDAAEMTMLARQTGLSAYDASYLWLAGSLGANLVTLDRQLIRASEALEP